MTQLFEMGFWNRELNEQLLEKNRYDVSDTVEDLLRPGRRAEPAVVSSQPRQTQGPGSFVFEFD
jgi:hypothetical protein